LKKLLLSLLLLPLAALAQTYPSKPVRMIVPSPRRAGGHFRPRARAGMSAELGQPVIIENVAAWRGAGRRPRREVAPDGYTLGFNSGSTLSIAPFSSRGCPTT